MGDADDAEASISGVASRLTQAVDSLTRPLAQDRARPLLLAEGAPLVTTNQAEMFFSGLYALATLRIFAEAVDYRSSAIAKHTDQSLTVLRPELRAHALGSLARDHQLCIFAEEGFVVSPDLDAYRRWLQGGKRSHLGFPGGRTNAYGRLNGVLRAVFRALVSEHQTAPFVEAELRHRADARADRQTRDRAAKRGRLILLIISRGFAHVSARFVLHARGSRDVPARFILSAPPAVDTPGTTADSDDKNGTEVSPADRW